MPSVLTEKTKATTAVYDKKAIRERNFPSSQNGDYCEYLGYIFSADGMVFSPTGNKLKVMRIDGLDYSTLILTSEKEKKHLVRVSLKHACYSMFARDIPENMQEKFLNDPGNAYVKSMQQPPRRRQTTPKTGRTKKFSEEKVRMIQKEYREYGRGYRDLSKKYGVCVVTISKIIKGVY